MKILLLSLLLALPASAQRKVWTWTPPAPNPQVGQRVVLAASAPTGLTAIFYYEFNFGPLGSQGGGFKAVLISPRGELLASKDVTEFTHYGPELVLSPIGAIRWKTVSVAKNALIMSDGTRLLKFSLSGKTGAISEEVADYFKGEEFVPLDSNQATLAGWLRTKGEYVGEFDYNPADHWNTTEVIRRMEAIELWSAK